MSLADLGETLCHIGGGQSLSTSDARSMAPLLTEPAHVPEEFSTGYAEYHGTRFPLMQRVLWKGPWKFVFNGFDFDELYNLEDDPSEPTQSGQSSGLSVVGEIPDVRSLAARPALERSYHPRIPLLLDAIGVRWT